MRSWGFTCLLALLGSLGSASAVECPADMVTAKQNLTFTERIEMSSIVVYGKSTHQDNATNFEVECVLKTDGFAIEDSIKINDPDCDGFGDLPTNRVNVNYIALIRRTYRGFKWTLFGHRQTAHGTRQRLIQIDPDFVMPCGLRSCSALVFDSTPCPGGNIFIRYETSPWTFRACCREKYYPGDRLDLRPGWVGQIEPYRLRNMPEVHLDPSSDGYYTVMMGEVSGNAEPYMNWLQVNLRAGTALTPQNTILQYEKPLPERQDSVKKYVFIVFEQREKLDYPVLLRPYASNARGCSKEYRCRFDIIKFQKDFKLTVVYNSDFTSRRDEYSRLEHGEAKLSICKDLWPEATVNMICPVTPTTESPDGSASTARSQVLGLTFIISIVLIFRIF